MRRIPIFLLAMALVWATPAFAVSGEGNHRPAASETKSVKAAAPKAKARSASAAMSDRAAIVSELARMQQMLEEQAQELAAQHKEIDALKHQIDASSARPPSATASIAVPEKDASLAAAESSTPTVTESASNTAPNAVSAANAAVSPLPVSDSASRVAARKSGPQEGPIAFQDLKIGTTFYGSFSHFTDAGFAPGFQDTPTTQLPPGNNGLNTFEVNRAYINLYYTPDEHVTLRITPDIYRQADNSYAFRLKYAYVDFQKIFGDGAFKDDKITFGQTQEGLIDWEEALSGYRYAYLTPWNYLSLSSTYAGARIHGPIEFNGKEYLDYDLGAFNTASFHSLETSDKKQVMGRLTVYPFGTTVDRTGFGLTVFENYGYNTKLPSQVSTPLNRFSFLAHYQTHNKAYQVAFEYQMGRNAVSTGNMFSGVGPAASNPFSTLAGTVLSGTRTHQQGYNFFGHARLGNSPFMLFGLFQYFQPNTNFQPSSLGLTDNPLDFERTVGGISYTVTNHFDFALGDENFHWVHPQGVVPGGDTNGIVIWTQFNY